MTSTATARPLFDPPIVRRAIIDSFRKLNPRHQVRNPVMFTVFVGSLLTAGLGVHALWAGGQESPAFILGVSAWLWFTVLFANFAEAMAEGRGKAQADSLRQARRDVTAKKLEHPHPASAWQSVPASPLRKDDVVLVEAGDPIPADGEVIEGVASVDESAITGESAPVIRESGGDRSSVTGGTRVLSDWLVVRITANPGEAFLDRMIALVEGAKRQKTPNEIALDILLAALTIIFLVVCVTLLPFSAYSVQAASVAEVTSVAEVARLRAVNIIEDVRVAEVARLRAVNTTEDASLRGLSVPVNPKSGDFGYRSFTPVTITVLVALLVCLIPTTIGGLLSAIGIAGMDRMIQANVIATSGRAVEAAGDVDVLLLDKTGTITLGNRQAVELLPAPGVELATLADAAQLGSLADETPEGRSIVVLAKEKYGLRGRNVHDLISSRSAAHRGDDRETRRHTAGRGRRPARAGRGPSEGHSQGRHQGTLRRTAAHGHQDGHDHRRQSADRSGHRCGSGR